jgi:hypothetical protein
MNTQHKVEMNLRYDAGLSPSPSVTLESLTNELNEAVSELEREAEALIKDLSSVSHRHPEQTSERLPAVVCPALPFALEQVRVTKERVASVMVLLHEARIALAL